MANKKAHLIPKEMEYDVRAFLALYHRRADWRIDSMTDETSVLYATRQTIELVEAFVAGLHVGEVTQQNRQQTNNTIDRFICNNAFPIPVKHTSNT